jgi:hypothetical protein
MAFNDGEPLDAAKLGALELQVNNLAANIPKIGASTTNVTVNNNTTPQQISIPQIVGKSLGTAWTLNPGPNELPITFDAPLNSVPKAVMITPRTGAISQWHPQINVKTQSMTKDGFTAIVYMPTGSAKHNVYISYIAICH